MTSPRTNFKANLRSAIRAYELHENGKSFEKQGFLPATVAMVNDFRSGKLDFKEEYRDGRRKIVHFANAILGKKDAVVVDSWMMRAYGLTQEYKWRDKILPYKPRITEYDLVETHIKAIAGTIFEPRQIVAMIWSGIRKFDVSYQKVDTDSLLREVLTK